MSTAVIAASSTEDLIAGLRSKRLTRTQVLAALAAAGATAAGAVLLVQAVENSPGTPATTPIVQSHAVKSLAPTTSQVAMHQRHVGMQVAGH
jgi:hypothetical protein